MASNNSVLSLPLELVEEICHLCPPSVVLTLRTTCRQLATLCDNIFVRLFFSERLTYLPEKQSMANLAEMTRFPRIAKKIRKLEFSFTRKQGSPHEVYTQSEQLEHLVNVFANLLACKNIPGVVWKQSKLDLDQVVGMVQQARLIPEVRTPHHFHRLVVDSPVDPTIFGEEPAAVLRLADRDATRKVLHMERKLPSSPIISSMTMTGFAPVCLELPVCHVRMESFSLYRDTKLNAVNLRRLSLVLNLSQGQAIHDNRRLTDLLAEAVALEYLDLDIPGDSLGVEHAASAIFGQSDQPILKALKYLIFSGFKVRHDEFAAFVSERRHVLEGVRFSNAMVVYSDPYQDETLELELWNLLNEKENAIVWAARYHWQEGQYGRRKGFFAFPEARSEYPALAIFWPSRWVQGRQAQHLTDDQRRELEGF